MQEEEKIRARAKKLLPKVNKELAAALKQWEDRYGSPLTYDGENYHSRMVRQRKEYADRKEEDKRRKEKEKADKKMAKAKKTENKFHASKSRNATMKKRRPSQAPLSQKNSNIELSDLFPMHNTAVGITECNTLIQYLTYLWPTM